MSAPAYTPELCDIGDLERCDVVVEVTQTRVQPNNISVTTKAERCPERATWIVETLCSGGCVETGLMCEDHYTMVMNLDPTGHWRCEKCKSTKAKSITGRKL